MQFEKWFQVDLLKPRDTAVDLGVLLCAGDDNSVRVGVRVKSGSADTDVTGNVKGYVLLPNGVGLVPFDGAKDGNSAWIDLPEGALALQGRITVSIRVMDTNETTVLLTATATVRRVDGDTHYDPTDEISDITDLIEDAEQAAADAADALAQATAVVSYAAQTGKTDTEKSQARANIGAGSMAAEISTPAKEALLACLARVAWTTDDGQDYYDVLEDLLLNNVTLSSVTAVFDPDGADIFDNADLDDLRQYLTVTANYSDGGSHVISNYNLYGTLEVGECTISAAYGGKSDTFTVTVVDVPSDYTALAYLTSTGTQYIDTGKVWTGASTYELKAKGLCTDTSTANWFIGALHSETGRNEVIGLNNTANASTVFFRYGTGGGTTGHSFTPSSSTEYTVRQEANVCKLDGTTHSSYDALTYTMDESIYLFARNNKGTTDSYAKCSIASFKLWNGSGDLILDLAPFLDDSNVPCMFDKVSKTTLYNAGTGTFSYTEVSA